LTIDAAAGNPERLPAGERVPRAVRDHWTVRARGTGRIPRRLRTRRGAALLHRPL